MSGKQRGKILVINEYASTPEVGMGGRSYYLSKVMGQAGHDIVMVAASPHHLLHKNVKFSGTCSLVKHRSFSILWFKNLRYLQPRSPLRVLNWFLFGLNLLRIPAILRSKPEAIIYSTPSIVPAFFAVLLSKTCGAKFILDVRDIWPKTLVQLGGYSETSIPIKLMRWIELFAYRHATAITSNIPLFNEYLKECNYAHKHFTWIPNGVDSSFKASQKHNDFIRKKCAKNDFIVGYVGTIGLANNLMLLIKAAKILEDIKKIKFAIIGNGNEKDTLVTFVNEQKINNVIFFDSISKEDVPDALSQLDACFIGWKNSSLYNYGIAANKIPEYMISGKPILHSYSGASDPVHLAQCGITTPADSEYELADAILKIQRMPTKDRQQMGINGLNYAKKNFIYEAAAERMLDLFEEIKS